MQLAPRLPDMVLSQADRNRGGCAGDIRPQKFTHLGVGKAAIGPFLQDAGAGQGPH